MTEHVRFASITRYSTVLDLSHVRFQGRTTERRLSAIGRGGAGAPRRSGAAGPDVSIGRPPPVRAALPLFVLKRAGLEPHQYRWQPLERRIGACLRALRADSEPAAYTRLDSHPGLLGSALSAFLIGVSGFFRDASVFDILRQTVVPALGTRALIRVCSIGCSSGAELYSIAILLAEAGLLSRASLLGVDCRDEAIAAARSGVFAVEAMSEVPEPIRSRYFEQVRSGWRVVETLRRQTIWQVADAIREPPRGPWDLALCRNLAIYLQPLASEALFRRLADSLTPGGFLVVGQAERPSPSLGLTAAGRCIFSRHDY